MSKLLLIDLGPGNLNEGFPTVTVQFWKSREKMFTQYKGYLPSQPKLIQLYREWKLLYNALHQRLDWGSRLKVVDANVTNVSQANFDELCFQLRYVFNDWLDSSAFGEILQSLDEGLRSDDEFQVIIETKDILLRRIPWHLWNFFDAYPYAEIALSASQWQGTNLPKSPIGIVRILAVFGNSVRLDLAQERKFLSVLPEADVEFLDEPSFKDLELKLCDDQGWDILFFAGHSNTEDETGWIHLNATESLTICQLDYALKKAINNGLQLAIFNSCDGLGLASQLEQLNIPQAIVMREPVIDRVAQRFLRYFLNEFANGETSYLAVKNARYKLLEIENHYPCASWLPVIIQNPTSSPLTWEILRDQGRLIKRIGLPMQMPPFPKRYVRRLEHSQPLRDLLLKEIDSDPNTLVVSAIYGLGGIGKSVMATILAHDPHVQRHFSDGVLWTTLGQSPDLQKILGNWIQALKDYNYKPTTLKSASQHLKTLLADKRMLLVVDDVWQPEHVELFRVGGKGCRILVTTRGALIQDAQQYDLDVMTEGQSLELITRFIKRSLNKYEQTKALAFAHAVGYLPLALELAAVQVNDEGFTWSGLLEEFEGTVADLELLDLPEAIPKSSDEYKRQFSLRACFNLSLKRLQPKLLGYFTWLGVLPEDVMITPRMIKTFWDVSEIKAFKILNDLKHRALLTFGPVLFDQTQTYRLHDLMHDTAQWLITKPASTEYINDQLPGLNLTLPEAQQYVLERFRQKTEDKKWSTLPDDGYIHAHLTWHMEQAGCKEEIHQLLQQVTPEGRNAWYEACDHLGQNTTFVTDVNRAWRLAEQIYIDDAIRSISLQVRYALIITTISSLAQQIPPCLVVSLIKHKKWSIAQGVAYAKWVKNDSQTAEIIREISPYSPASLLPELLSLTSCIPDENFCLVALSGIVPSLPQNLLSEALSIARRFSSENTRSSALCMLVPYLPDIADEALEAVRNIKYISDGDAHVCIDNLIKLIQQMPEIAGEVFELACENMSVNSTEYMKNLVQNLPHKFLPKVLDLIDSKSVNIRIIVLEELSQSISKEVLSKAIGLIVSSQSNYLVPDSPKLLALLARKFPIETLNEVRTIQDKDVCAFTLAKLVKHLPEIKVEALNQARAIRDQFMHTFSLIELVPYIPEIKADALNAALTLYETHSCLHALQALLSHSPEMLGEILNTILSWENINDCEDIFIHLVPYQPKLAPLALDIANSYLSDSSRANALRVIIPYLPEDLLLKALNSICDIQDERWRENVLRKLVPCLSGDLLSLSLAKIRTIRDDYYSAVAIRELIPYFPEIKTKALEMARIVQHDYYRAKALRELIPYLPEVVGEALDMTITIQYGFYQDEALRALVSYLSKDLVSDLLDAARSFMNKSNFAGLLTSLLPYFSEGADEALYVTLNIQNEITRCACLRSLLPHLNKELLPELLNKVGEFKDQYARFVFLRDLVPYLPEAKGLALSQALAFQNEIERYDNLKELLPYLPQDLLLKVLNEVRTFKKPSMRIFALREIAKYSSEIRAEVLEINHSIQKDSDLALILKELVPFLPQTLLSTSIDLVQTLPDEYDRAMVLRKFLPYLSENLLRKAMDIAQSYHDENVRIIALENLLPYLPENLLPKAIDLAKTIQNEVGCSRALRELAPRLPKDLLVEALNIASTLKSEPSRASALNALIPYLPKYLVTEVLDITRSFDYDSHRADVMRNLLSTLDFTCISFDLWSEVLTTISYSSREELLEDIPKLAPAMIALAGSPVLDLIVVSIEEVNSQWI